MRIPLILTASGLAMALGACASDGAPTSRYASDMRALQDSCDARQGVLVPIPGATSGRPETDYACEIRAPSRIPNR